MRAWMRPSAASPRANSHRHSTGHTLAPGPAHTPDGTKPPNPRMHETCSPAHLCSINTLCLPLPTKPALPNKPPTPAAASLGGPFQFSCATHPTQPPTHRLRRTHDKANAPSIAAPTRRPADRGRVAGGRTCAYSRFSAASSPRAPRPSSPRAAPSACRHRERSVPSAPPLEPVRFAAPTSPPPASAPAIAKPVKSAAASAVVAVCAAGSAILPTAAAISALALDADLWRLDGTGRAGRGGAEAGVGLNPKQPKP